MSRKDSPMQGLQREERQPHRCTKKATLPAHPTRPNPRRCRYFGHTWQRIGFSDEKQCTICGLKSYCPGCTSRPPQGAYPHYCLAHLSASPDAMLHPPENPFCYNPSCCCHTDRVRHAQVQTFMMDGLLTVQEASDFVQGKMI